MTLLTIYVMAEKLNSPAKADSITLQTILDSGICVMIQIIFFGSGSECPSSLENTRFFAHFNAFFAQNRVSHLCLKIFDAFLML
jgi:hypothetical protein